MAARLLIPGITFAALCVWLTVRIVNRQERWAKWTLAVVVGLPVLYVLSFGPACWLTTRAAWLRSWNIQLAYSPIIRAGVYGPVPVREAITWWGSLGIPAGTGVILSADASRDGFIWIFGE